MPETTSQRTANTRENSGNETGASNTTTDAGGRSVIAEGSLPPIKVQTSLALLSEFENI